MTKSKTNNRKLISQKDIHILPNDEKNKVMSSITVDLSEQSLPILDTQKFRADFKRVIHQQYPINSTDNNERKSQLNNFEELWDQAQTFTNEKSNSSEVNQTMKGKYSLAFLLKNQRFKFNPLYLSLSLLVLFIFISIQVSIIDFGNHSTKHRQLIQHPTIGEKTASLLPEQESSLELSFLHEDSFTWLDDDEWGIEATQQDL